MTDAAAPVTRAPRRIQLSDLPLWVRLVGALLLLLGLALAVTGAVAATTLRHYLLARVDNQLAAVTQGAPLGGPGRRQGGRGDDGPQQLNAFYIRYTTIDGTFVDEVTTGEPAPRLPPLTVATVNRYQGRPFTVPAVSGESSWRVVVAPLRDRSGIAAVALSTADEEQTVSQLLLIEGVVGVVVLVLLGGLAYLVVRSSLRPLVEVEHTAAAIAAGDLSQRVPEGSSRTEVGRLSGALNGMLGQIESSFARQRQSESSARESEQRMRRFVADASHELRTPLTSIRGFAELYRQGAVREPAEVRRVMRRVEDEAARMGLLVDELLLLARLDQQRPLEEEPVDLLMLAGDAVTDSAAVDPQRPVRLEVAKGSAAPLVLGDEARLRQVVGNLLGNARTHTPPGTPVEVRVGTQGDLAYLEVADEGPGLAPEQAARVFERFYRADAARTRGTGGSGLGLSIVAALVHAHGGRVGLETGPGQGATFRVELPLLEQTGDPVTDEVVTQNDPPLTRDRSAGGALPAAKR
jgi:two-component system, OmpR family, sensor kinase